MQSDYHKRVHSDGEKLLISFYWEFGRDSHCLNSFSHFFSLIARQCRENMHTILCYNEHGFHWLLSCRARQSHSQHTAFRPSAFKLPDAEDPGPHGEWMCSLAWCVDRVHARFSLPLFLSVGSGEREETEEVGRPCPLLLAQHQHGHWPLPRGPAPEADSSG